MAYRRPMSVAAFYGNQRAPMRYTRATRGRMARNVQGAWRAWQRRRLLASQRYLMVRRNPVRYSRRY